MMTPYVWEGRTVADMLHALHSGARLNAGMRKAIVEALNDLMLRAVEEDRRRARHRHVDDALFLRFLVMEALMRGRGLMQEEAAAEVTGDDPGGGQVAALCRGYRRFKKRKDISFVISDDISDDDPLLNEVLAAIKARREPLKPDRRRG